MSNLELLSITNLFDYNYLMIKKLDDYIPTIDNEQLLEILKELIALHVIFEENLLKIMERRIK